MTSDGDRKTSPPEEAAGTSTSPEEAVAGEQGAPAESPGPSGPPETPEDVAAQLATALEEAAQFRDRWVRERADLENLKKRSAREYQEARRYGAEGLARDLLHVVDDLERALDAAREAGVAEQLTEGVDLTLRKFLEILGQHGVTRVPAQGERFDPAHHEAVAHMEHPETEAGMVIEEHRGGYRLHDRLLRASMVTVSKGRPEADLANPEDRD